MTPQNNIQMNLVDKMKMKCSVIKTLMLVSTIFVIPFPSSLLVLGDYLLISQTTQSQELWTDGHTGTQQQPHKSMAAS